MWTIKEEPLKYESIGCGSRVMDIDESFRPVSGKYLRDILEAGITDKAVGKMLRKILFQENRGDDEMIYKKRPELLLPYV